MNRCPGRRFVVFGRFEQQRKRDQMAATRTAISLKGVAAGGDMQAAPPAGTWMRQQPGFSTAFLTGGVWERRDECGALEEMEEETVPSKRPLAWSGVAHSRSLHRTSPCS